MNLGGLTPKQRAKIRGFDASLDADFRHRLRELGFFEGAEVEYVRAIPFGGPRVFRVSDAIYSIEPWIAAQILIDV